jgi:serine/threonine protein kinase
MTNDDLELYVMGSYDGDVAALEQQLAADPDARAFVAKEADFELLLRDAAASATFCVACDDLVRGERCESCGAAMRPGGYTVERLLVSSAHGRMYVAHDADGKQVALKELAFVHSPTLDAIAAFEREAKFLRALEHPAIPRFCASFEEGRGVHTRYYLAQELVAGEALDVRLADHWYSETEIVEIARQVLDVLVYLQRLSPMIVHRDIKPANLLRRADGVIALVDFGAAHVQGTTAGSTSIGTFGYMPIEQLAGIVDATTDVFALGASLVHLLTRREPWRMLGGASLDAVNVSPQLRAWLAKLVAPEPKERYPGAAAALEALDAIRLGTPPPRVVERWSTAARAMVVAAAAISLSGVGAFGYWLSARSSSSSSSPPPAASSPIAPVVVTMQTTPPATPVVELRLPHGGKLIDLDFKAAPLRVVLGLIADQCSLNVVVPDTVDAAVTVRLVKVPCDQALEVILESHGLWYDYRKGGNLVRISPRRQLDSELEDAVVRTQRGITPDILPAGPNVTFAVDGERLRTLLDETCAAGGVNLVLPDTIDGRVSLHIKDVPWNLALQTILESHGLWYRYRDDGRLLRVAPRRELDAEDEDALSRAKIR